MIQMRTFLTLACWLTTSTILIAGPTSAPSTRVAGRPHLAFRLVVDAKANDPAVEIMPEPFSGEAVAVSREEVLDESSVREVTFDPADRGIRLTMTDAGGERLKQVTGANIDKRIAI